jgi:endoribonuclease Dicer
MVEEGSDVEARWRRFVLDEENLKKIYRSRDDDENPDEPVPDESPRLVVESTGAFLSYSISVALLSEVCSLLPRDAYSPLPRPVFDYVLDRPGEGGYSATVTLPMAPFLKPDQRRIVGPMARSKKGAKQAAAYEACVLIYQQGGLDENLRPIREKRADDARDANGEEVDTAPIADRVYFKYDNPFGSMHDPSDPLWMYPLHFACAGDGNDDFGAPEATLGLIVATRLDIDDAIPLWEDRSSDHPSLTMRLGEPVSLDWNGEERERNLARIDSFTRMVLQAAIQSRPFEDRIFQYVVPLVPCGEICWEVIDEPLYDVVLSELSPGDLIVSPYRGIPRSRLHVFEVVREDVQLTDAPISITTPSGTEQQPLKLLSKFKSYEHLFRTRVSLDPAELELPFLQLAALPRPRGWLSPPRKIQAGVASSTDADANDDGEEETTAAQGEPEAMRQVLPVSVTRRSNISREHWRLLQAMPSYVRAIEDRVRVKKALSVLGLPPIPIPMAIQALTLPGHNTDVRILSLFLYTIFPMLCLIALLPFFKYDYETLETFGDSFLKLATSVFVYMELPNVAEGGLTM